MVKPFKVDISDQIIKDIYDKVKKYPWHEMPNDGGWEYGTNLDYMKEISKYWVSKFDWRKHESEINKFKNFIAEVDNIDIHFIHEKGSGAKPMPLLISHGWPGTIVEFLHIIEKLAHPERFGGKEEDAFDVIAPSLPGFGFSGRPSRPIGPRKIADIFNNLMTKKLGYKNYLAQGGDWGGAITTWLGYDHSETCNAIHINIFTMRHPDGPQTKEEKDWETEYLSPTISVKRVSGVEDAINHINKYGSSHTDSIVTKNKKTAKKFLSNINSSIAIHNASTQFADGGEFGFGAEVGISTTKLHPRGPIGLDQLTTYKYILEGKGQIRK